jgi:hypothetical protein
MPRHTAKGEKREWGRLSRFACIANRMVLASSIVVVVVCLTAISELLLSAGILSLVDSAVVVGVLGVLAAVAIYRKMSRTQHIEGEHPLTSSPVYRTLYNMSPLEGALAGSIVSLGNFEVGRAYCFIAAGAVGMSVCMWLIVDPVAGLLEMMTTGSRRLRARRMAKIEGMRSVSQRRSEVLLASLQEEEQRKMIAWKKVLDADADELTRITLAGWIDQSKEERVSEIGAKAFKVGGGECMKYLYSTVEQRCKAHAGEAPGLWFVSIWWDGIGDWRSRWMEGEYAL